MKHKGIFILFALWWVGGCRVQQNLEDINLSYLYQEQGLVLHPDFRIYQHHPDSATVFFQTSGSQLLYIKEQGQPDFIARMQLTYRLYTDYERTTLLDSGHVKYTDIQPVPGENIFSEVFKIHFSKASHNQKYVLVIHLLDENRNYTFVDLLDIDIHDAQCNQTFLMTDARKQICYRPFFPQGVPFYLQHNSNPKTYKVRYYNRDFPIATPPFAKNVDQTFSYQADSTWQISARDSIVLNMPGFYHFQLNESSKAGFTVFSFYNEFPEITRKEHLGEPLRYLTTNDEFDAMKVNDPQAMKLAVDKFWLKIAGNAERGQALVSAYYGRIQTANLHFTSYIEGWKTDRGIIYTMLGPPTEVNRNAFQEFWVYGDPNSSLNHVYTFSKMTNPFTNNDYVLTRSNNYRYGWGQALEAWRHGDIYDITEIKRAQDERDRQQRNNPTPYFWY